MNKMNGVITEILLSCRNISVEYGKKDSFTEKAALKLTEKLAEKISLPNLAAEFNMSYSKFRREFKKRSGEAPGSYRKRKRFEKAQIILAENNLTIGQIAEKLGYVDIYTFSKHFKKYFGISPTEFRKGKVY
jgi:AraC-like DNA-binding protein